MPKRVWRTYSTRQIQSDICISASILSSPVLLLIQAAISIYPEGITVLPYINNECFRWKQSSNRESKSRTNKTKENSSELTCFVKLAAKQFVFPALPPYCQLSDFTAVTFTSHILMCHLPAQRCMMITIKKTWEILVNSRSSVCNLLVFHKANCMKINRDKYILPQQGKNPQTQPTHMQWEYLFGKLFCVFVGFVRAFCRFSFCLVGLWWDFLKVFFLSHLQVNRLEV